MNTRSNKACELGFGILGWQVTWSKAYNPYNWTNDLKLKIHTMSSEHTMHPFETMNTNITK